MKQPYAEEVNYWQTSTKSPDTWIDSAKKEIKGVGGTVLNEAYGSDHTGRAAFMLMFQIGDDMFKVVWPVLLSKGKNEKAARVQAATMLYHDVKSKCVSAKVLGTRAAFFGYLLLPNGVSVSQMATPDLQDAIPELLSLPSGKK